MATLAELKHTMQAELKAMKDIADSVPAGSDLSQADLTTVREHQKSYDAAKREHEKLAQSESIKASLAAIGLDLGIGGIDPDAVVDAKNVIVEHGAGDYKSKAAAQWALKAATRMQESLDARQGTKSIEGTRTPVPDPITGPVNLPEERHTILNLIPTRSARGNSLDSNGGNVFGFTVQSTRTNNANAVPDGTLKPTSVYAWSDKVDRFRTIAHLSEPQPNRILADHDQLVRFLQEEMGRGVLDEVEAQILNGTGTIAATADGTPTAAEEQLPGILNTSGIQAQAWDTDLLTTLSAAYDQLVLANEVPNAWVLHPLDYRRLKNMREDGTTGPLMFKSGRSSIEQILGEIPVITTPLIPQGTGLVGDFRQTLLVTREEATVTSTEGDGSLFDYNLTKFRAEGRYGFAVLRPNAFVEVDLTAA